MTFTFLLSFTALALSLARWRNAESPIVQTASESSLDQFWITSSNIEQLVHGHGYLAGSPAMTSNTRSTVERVLL